MDKKDIEIRRLQAQVRQLMQVQESLAARRENDTLEYSLRLLQREFLAVVFTDPEGRINWLNPGFTELSGYTLAQANGQSLWDLLPTELTSGESQAGIQDCLAKKMPFQYELPARPGACPADWLRLKVQPILNEGGDIIQLTGMLEDISDWKKIQGDLFASEERFRYLTENVPGVLYQWRENYDGTSYAVYASPKSLAIFGIAPDQVSHILNFVHPDDQSRWVESIKDSNTTGTPWFFEGRLVVPGQPLRWCRGNSLQSARDQFGIMYSGIMVDVTPLKLAEETMRASEVRWRLAIEGFGDGNWEYNYQTGEEFFSHDFKTMLGYSSDEEFLAAGPSWVDHVHPDDIAPSLAAAAAYLRGEVPIYSLERRVRCQNGNYKWVLTRGLTTKCDEAGVPLIMTGVHTDISASHEAKAAIEASKLRLFTTIANLQEGVLLEDENRKVVLANEAFCRMFKLPETPEQLTGVDCAAYGDQAKHHFKDEAGFVRRLDELVQGRELATGDILELKDGRTFQRDFVPIQVDSTSIGHLWKYQDITERKNSEDALRRQEEKYRGILENMKLGLVEMDLDDRVVSVNQAFCDILGFEAEELINQQALQPLLMPESQRLMIEQNQARTAGIADAYEIAIRTKSGESKWLQVSGAPLYNDNKLVGSIGINLDITHQKQLEHKLREAKEHAEESSKAKERFLANMSHEIRTPMNAILGMSQLLNKTPLTEQQESYLHAITTSGDNLLVIINDILDLSKVEAGKVAIEHVGFSLHKVLEQLAKNLQYKAEEKGLSLITKVNPVIPNILIGDPYRITQVLLNLASNSLKFTEKGQVCIACDLRAGSDDAVDIEFTVSDTGDGIAPDYLAHIFEEFSQEDSSVSRKFGGTGLGLTISKGLVNLMGGEVLIDSEKSRGTTVRFILRLPVGSAKDLPGKDWAAETNEIRARLRGKRVLLVEDNFFNRLLAKEYLAQANMNVMEAENGAIAVELARKNTFDLVLMDVQMPVMNGLEATSHFRSTLGLTTPIVALTANAINGEREKCLAAGMDDYLAKPFQEDELMKVMYDWLVGPNYTSASLPEPPVRRVNLRTAS
jgi:PAS domain S-box-containing protein